MLRKTDKTPRWTKTIGVVGKVAAGRSEKVRVNLCTAWLDEGRHNVNKPSPSQQKISIYLLIRMRENQLSCVVRFSPLLLLLLVSAPGKQVWPTGGGVSWSMVHLGSEQTPSWMNITHPHHPHAHHLPRLCRCRLRLCCCVLGRLQTKLWKGVKKEQKCWSFWRIVQAASTFEFLV